MSVFSFFHELCDGVHTFIGIADEGVANVVKAMVSSVGWSQAPGEEKLSVADTSHLPKNAADSKQWMYMVMGCSLKAFGVAAFGYVLYRLYKWWSKNDKNGKAVSDTLQGGETDDAALRRVCDHESLHPLVQRLLDVAVNISAIVYALLILGPLLAFLLGFLLKLIQKIAYFSLGVIIQYI